MPLCSGYFFVIVHVTMVTGVSVFTTWRFGNVGRVAVPFVMSSLMASPSMLILPLPWSL